jgi:hypothetical protein
MASKIDYTTVAEETISYTFRTDAEHGEIVSRDFDEAKQMLCDMCDDDMIADGGWGWVDDQDGERFYVGRENMG